MLNPVVLLLPMFSWSVAGVASGVQPPLPGAGVAPRSSVQAYGYTFCDKKTGMCMLKANLSMVKTTTTFSDFDLCRYEPREKKWHGMPLTADVEIAIAPEPRQVYSRETDPVVRLLTDVKGLLWLSWREDGRAVSSFVHSGMPCQDVMVGPERNGDLIATCIPGIDTATADYVPDPEKYCIHGSKRDQEEQGQGH